MNNLNTLSHTTAPEWADPDYNDAVDNYNQIADEYNKTVDAWQSLASEVTFAGNQPPKSPAPEHTEHAEHAESAAHAEHTTARSAELIAESNEKFKATSEALATQNSQLRKFLGAALPDLFQENGNPRAASYFGEKFGSGSTAITDFSSQRLDLLRTLVEGTFPIGEEPTLAPKQLADLRDEYLKLGSKKSSTLGAMLSDNSRIIGPDTQRQLDHIAESATSINRDEDKFILAFLDDPTEENLSHLWENSANGIGDLVPKSARAGYTLDDLLHSAGYQSSNFGDGVKYHSQLFGDAHNATTKSLIDFLRFRADEHFARKRHSHLTTPQTPPAPAQWADVDDKLDFSDTF